MNGNGEILIQVKGLCKYYNGGKIKALDGVDIRRAAESPRFCVRLIFWNFPLRAKLCLTG